MSVAVAVLEDGASRAKKGHNFDLWLLMNGRIFLGSPKSYWLLLIRVCESLHDVVWDSSVMILTAFLSKLLLLISLTLSISFPDPPCPTPCFLICEACGPSAPELV